jgi:hypothetical protein
VQQQVESAVRVAGYLDNSASLVLVHGRELYMQVELACVLGRAFVDIIKLESWWG